MNDPLGVKLLSYLSLPGVKLLSCLSLQFSYLNEHKFRYSFSDINNPMCVCVGLSVELNLRPHFFSLHSHSFVSAERSKLFDNLTETFH